MTVEPTNRSPVQPSKTGKPSEAKAGNQPDTKKQVAAKLPNTVIDKVEFSSAAQELHELASADRIYSNTLPAERMQEILKRVADGFYDRQDVLDETVKRAVDDL